MRRGRLKRLLGGDGHAYAVAEREVDAEHKRPPVTFGERAVLEEAPRGLTAPHDPKGP